MKGMFTSYQVHKILTDYKYLVGTENYINPYPILKVGFIRAQMNSDGSYDVNVGVDATQLEFPEFMGYGEHYRPLLIFLKIKGIAFDAAKYGF